MSQSFLSRGLVGAVALVLSSAAAAQAPDGAPVPVVRFTELAPNPPGTDNGQEFIELAGTPGASLNGFVILVVEGDATAAGVVDVVYDLTGQSLGTNGLFLRRDAATALNSGMPIVVAPGPNPATVVHVLDFAPDIENGSNTYFLLYAGGNPVPAIGTDLDSDNDGALNPGALAGLVVVDAVGVVENDTGINVAYADDFGFANVGPFATFTPDALYRERDCDGTYGGWRAGDLSNTSVSPGPYFFFAANTSGFPFGPGSTWSLDPGRLNHCTFDFAISEPAGFGTLEFAITGGEPNGLYLTALSFDPANAAPAYAGLHGGLAITADELLFQYNTLSAPFVGFLDAAGDGGSTYFDGLPPVLAGATIYGLTLVYSGTYGEITGRTAVAALTLSGGA